jgi:hypothetical protein
VGISANTVCCCMLLHAWLYAWLCLQVAVCVLTTCVRGEGTCIGRVYLGAYMPCAASSQWQHLSSVMLLPVVCVLQYRVWGGWRACISTTDLSVTRVAYVWLNRRSRDGEQLA